MKPNLLALLLCLAPLVGALANDTPSAAPAALQKSVLKCTVGELSAYATLLRSLDSFERSMPGKTPEDPPVIRKVPCAFSGQVRFTIFTNLAAVDERLEVYQAARTALILSISGGKRSIPADDTAGIAAFVAEDAKLREVPVDIEITLLPIADLRLEQNDIPVSTLAALRDFIAR